ncbi:diguanylate cyclase [Actinomycetospora sp. NBRC 106375]|uniref:GGDEF domain-containing protein n=1 Tax=Actinomycetospora sp. NBRC 106375 TaxID=3032207 RepID=UPI0024A26887|nr:diguanylate cyclase [Actinomycetospora sp. NBRC 106375]GLZ48528.1 diguanylate cyclase [Actinomycetospora sp. NBRC 106375]
MLPGRTTVAPDPAARRDELVGRAGAATLAATRVPAPDPWGSLAVLDALLDEARVQGDPGLHALVLRQTLVARVLLAAAPDGPALDHADERGLDELIALSADHGLTLFGADAQMLVARRALLGDDEDAALAAVSAGLAHLEEPVLTDLAPTVAEHHRNVCCSRRLAASTLVSLGMHDLAEPLLEEAGAGDPSRESGALAYERVRLGVSWGLRLERAGRRGQDRMTGAAAVAQDMRRRAAPEELPLLRAATVLARTAPGVATTAAARQASRRDAEALARGDLVSSQHDRLVTHLAAARALEHAGDTEAAAALLTRLRACPPRGEASLMLSVTRELARLSARLSGPGGAPCSVDAAVRDYVADLEEELWSLHRARALSLRTRLAHERLRREHGQVAALALADPLTGLPNRRALDRCLSEALGPAVAMIDVDGFKQINDTVSHTHGDEVLRGVAAALRSSLRAPDLVARYGGDEFVVVLPDTAVDDAGAALGRACRAVAGLAGAGGRAVTLSVGVVGARPGEPVAAVLARADAAMYAVKRAGGNAVLTEA